MSAFRDFLSDWFPFISKSYPEQFLEQVASTNSYLMERLRTEELPHMFCVYTYCQTAGRGQKGNSWESAPYSNISMSLLLDSSKINPQKLWRVSMATALAVCFTLREEGLEATVKWPNDIYVGDRKICGILIENILQGDGVKGSVAGIGLNVNQLQFVSNAPNPTSMRIETGRDFDLETIRKRIVRKLAELWVLTDDASVSKLHALYMSNLYRREGLYLWQRAEVSTQPMAIVQHSDKGFMASIDSVTDTGELQLRLKNGQLLTFHFKEIKYVIN